MLILFDRYLHYRTILKLIVYLRINSLFAFQYFNLKFNSTVYITFIKGCPHVTISTIEILHYYVLVQQ